MRIAFVIAILGFSACTTVQPPPEPVVVTTPRPATAVIVPAKPVTSFRCSDRHHTILRREPLRRPRSSSTG